MTVIINGKKYRHRGNIPILERMKDDPTWFWVVLGIFFLLGMTNSWGS
tara:strand:- start:9982 stop:10125 length:144 start_codon:yes stop_codon:yes gene_type:complete